MANWKARGIRSENVMQYAISSKSSEVYLFDKISFTRINQIKKLRWRFDIL